MFGLIPVVGGTSGLMWAVSICLIAPLRSVSAVVDIVGDVYYYYYLQEYFTFYRSIIFQYLERTTLRFSLYI